MKQTGIMILLTLITLFLHAQENVPGKLAAEWKSFCNDAQLKYALAGICVLDAQTGKVLFEKNSNTGMAPASTQKVITAIASFEAFGPAYQYITEVGYTGKIASGKLTGDLVITGHGDPTLASPRYTATNENKLLANICTAVKKAGIDTITGNIVGTDNGFDLNPVPGGWIWADMGNYYGAGHWAINWNENQYDLLVKTGSRENEPIEVTGTNPALVGTANFVNEVKTGKPGTGDMSIIYADPFSVTSLYQGTLEPNKNKVSGSIPNADLFALQTIRQYLQSQKIFIKGQPINNLQRYANQQLKPSGITPVYTHHSPTLDSLVYWFLKKSINLYGEAFVRTIGMEKKGNGSVEKGLEWVDSLYAANGVDSKAMRLSDGCGLSPANRITPLVITKALQFAKGRSWFSHFYDALPLYNNMKLKSGTIAGVKSFAGYHTSKTGKQYIVSFIVNNYNGSPSALVNKMFTVLNALK